MSEEVKQIRWEDIKNQMAGLLPMSEGATWEFVPSAFNGVPEEFRPTFSIRQFTMGQVEEIKTIMTNAGDKGKKQKSEAQIQEAFLEMLHKALVGWENLLDLATGEPFKYDKTRECMMKVPQPILLEIFQEALVVGGVMTREMSEYMKSYKG